ncbi:hypothetical protein A2U01_0038640, partial [Trifolium medium]|nr:hypothetical protein [Trifolium medium]
TPTTAGSATAAHHHREQPICTAAAPSRTSLNLQKRPTKPQRKFTSLNTPQPTAGKITGAGRNSTNTMKTPKIEHEIDLM